LGGGAAGVAVGGGGVAVGGGGVGVSGDCISAVARSLSFTAVGSWLTVS